MCSSKSEVQGMHTCTQNKSIHSQFMIVVQYKNIDILNQHGRGQPGDPRLSQHGQRRGLYHTATTRVPQPSDLSFYRF